MRKESGMAFLLLIQERRGDRDQPAAVGRDRMNRMVAWGETLQARGILVARESLRMDDDDGARVQIRGGTRIVVDGPFAESKEIVGGFFYLTCDTKAEALAVAGECPAAEWATVEVRKIGPCFSE
jgi:hypothetical protein